MHMLSYFILILCKVHLVFDVNSFEESLQVEKSFFSGVEHDESMPVCLAASKPYQIFTYIIFLFQSNADKLYRKLARLKSNKDTPRRFKRDGPLGLFGRQVDLADHDEKKLEDLEERVRIEQSLLAGQVGVIWHLLRNCYLSKVLFSVLSIKKEKLDTRNYL